MAVELVGSKPPARWELTDKQLDELIAHALKTSKERQAQVPWYDDVRYDEDC